MLHCRSAWYVAAVLALAITVPSAAAQQPFVAPLAPKPASAQLGPTFAAMQFGIHADQSAPTELKRDAFKTSRREGRVLAIVGGAALIAGLLIGDDAGTLIAIGGAGLGLYGLYIWQR